MSVTLADLVAEVEDFLSSHGADRDKVCTLTGSINNSVTSLTVDDATLVDRGLLEIDYELIAVKSKDNSTGIVTVQPWGRGQRSTLAAAHSSNARVAVNPRFPRSRIKTEINTAISNMFPDLFAVATDTSNTFKPSVNTYAIPATAEWVLEVAVNTVGPSGVWLPCTRYRFNYTANTTSYPTGRTVDLGQGFTPGRTIQVTYATAFGALNVDTDTLSSIGVDDSWRDLIVLQVCSKMVMALDSSALQNGTMEQQAHTIYVQPGTATTVSKQLVQMYLLRLASEKQLLQQRYPARLTVAN